MLPFTFHGVLLDVVEVLGMFLEGRHGPTLYRSISLSCKPQAADTAGLRKPSDKDLRSLELWPRVEQRKWILGKKRKQQPNHQKNNSAGRVTRKIKKQTRKNKQKTNQNLHFPQFFVFFFVSLVGVLFFFAFFLFFLGFGFLVCFFCLLCFFCQTLYSLCCWTHNSRAPRCIDFVMVYGLYVPKLSTTPQDSEDFVRSRYGHGSVRTPRWSKQPQRYTGT